MLGWMPKVLKQILLLKQTVTRWSPSGHQVVVKNIARIANAVQVTH